MSFNGYVRVPPDSTGKKIGHVVLLELDYNTGATDFNIGEIVVGVTSGAEGTVVKVAGTTTTGELYLALDYESPIAFIIGENLQVNAVTKAKAASVGSTLYTPTVSIVDHENSLRGVNVTSDGELIISPAEGPFGFDSFGNLSVSQEHYLGLYKYDYGLDRGLLYTTSSHGATLDSGSNWSGVTLTNPITNGAVSRIQSHIYHPYFAGTGHKWIGSINAGDTGKTGLIRRWGYFDDNDGLFFEMSGSTMNVVVRSSVSGVIVETKTPQTEWNVDNLNGTGGDLNLSNITLDASKGRVYFIDFQWLGVGRVRFGVIAQGKRTVCHQIFNGGEIEYPYMRTGTLPCRIEQINYGTLVSISELRSYSMAVIAASRSDPNTEQLLGQTTELTRTINWTDSFRPLFSVRPKETYYGKPNRIITIPNSLQLYCENAPCVFQIIKWPLLTGDTWTAPTSSYGSLIGDFTATTASFGGLQWTKIVPKDTEYTEEFSTEWDDSYKIHRLADIADNNCAWTVMGKLLNTNSAPSASVSVTFNWREIF